MLRSFVWGMPSGRTKISPKSGRGLSYVTRTIFGSTVGYPSDSLASCCCRRQETTSQAVARIADSTASLHFRGPVCHFLLVVLWNWNQACISNGFRDSQRQREGTQSQRKLYFSYLWGGQPSANSYGIWRTCCTSLRNLNVQFF